MMPQESVPILRRSHSSPTSGSPYVDRYDQAEKGFPFNLNDDNSGTQQPPKTKKKLSFRHSLRSSDSILIGESSEGFDPAISKRAGSQTVQSRIYWCS